MEPLQVFVGDLMTKNYVKQNDIKSEEQINREKQERLAGYMALITLGMTSFLWKDSIQALDKVWKLNIYLAYFITFYFAFAITSMVLGMVACKFPLSTPAYMGTAGNGALQGLVIIMIGLHMDTFAYYPCYLCAIICAAITTSIVIFHWSYSAQDPVWLHAMAKFLAWGSRKALWWFGWFLWELVMFLWWLLISLFWDLPCHFLCGKKVDSQLGNDEMPTEQGQDHSSYEILSEPQDV